MTSKFGSAYSAGVLVAVSIPIFTAQLRKARIATNEANARAAYAAATAEYLTNDAIRGGTYDVSTGKFTSSETAPTAAANADYGASPTITSFTVVINPAADAANPVSVSPKDTSSEGTYNKAS